MNTEEITSQLGKLKVSETNELPAPSWYRPKCTCKACELHRIEMKILKFKLANMHHTP